MPRHGRIGHHPVRVDPPTLTGRVARPCKADIAPGCRCGAEPPDDRLRGDRRVLKISGHEAVEDVLIRGQTCHQPFERQVGCRCYIHGREPAGVREVFGGRHLHHHARGAVRTRPDHAGRRVDVARLHPMAEHWAVGSAADRGQGKACGKGSCTGENSAAIRSHQVGHIGISYFWHQDAPIKDRPCKI